MPQIGPLEMLMVAFLALVVFGPQKLPGMARKAGRTLHDLKRAAADVKREVNLGMNEGSPDGSAASTVKGSDNGTNLSDPAPANGTKPTEPVAAAAEATESSVGKGAQ